MPDPFDGRRDRIGVFCPDLLAQCESANLRKHDIQDRKIQLGGVHVFEVLSDMGKPSFLCFFSAIHFHTQKKAFLAFLIINILMHPADQSVVYGCHEENAYVMTNRLTISNTFPVMISAGTEQRQAIKEPIPMMVIPTRAASLYFPIIILPPIIRVTQSAFSYSATCFFVTFIRIG